MSCYKREMKQKRKTSRKHVGGEVGEKKEEEVFLFGRHPSRWKHSRRRPEGAPVGRNISLAVCYLSINILRERGIRQRPEVAAGGNEQRLWRCSGAEHPRPAPRNDQRLRRCLEAEHSRSSTRNRRNIPHQQPSLAGNRTEPRPPSHTRTD